MAGRRGWQVFVMLGGLIAWAVQFTVLYGATSTVCARGWAGATLFGFGLVPATIVGTTLVALAATAAILVHAVRQNRRLQEAGGQVTDVFLAQAAVLISGLSLAAIAWHGLPAFILPACS
jgi:ABC-type amino acid transport system permease subunit